MRLRRLALLLGCACAVTLGAARAGRRALLTVLAAQAALAAGAAVAGARRFVAPPVQPRDGSGAGYHIDAAELFGLGAGRAAPGRRLVDGAPLVDYGPLGERYNPAYAAWWALAHVNRYADHGDSADRGTALAAVHALAARAERGEGAAHWPYDFDWPVFDSVLRAPWLSAMAQGLAISALVRAYRLTGEEAHLTLARAALHPFEVPAERGGVHTEVNGRVYYEEYPVAGGSLVLDGTLFGLLGLYDLWTETGEPTVLRLFSDGVEGIAANLHVWDFHGLWSWYGRSGRLCTPAYHALNVALLDVTGRLSGREELCTVAARWERSLDSPWRRTLAFTAFWATMYVSGLRQRAAGARVEAARR